MAFVPGRLFKRQEVLALLHLPGKREWDQIEFHKLLFFFSSSFWVVEEFVLAWGQHSLLYLYSMARS